LFDLCAKKHDQKSHAEGGGFRRGERRDDLDRDHEEEEGGGISFRRGWKGRIKREAAMFFIRRNRLKTKRFLIYFVDIFVFIRNNTIRIFLFSI